MKRAWITGARGFIGRHLALHLSGGNHHVVGLGHGSWPGPVAAKFGVAQWLNGDIDERNLDLLQQQGGVPDVIYHLAGGSAVGPSIANPVEDFERTVHTTVRLLDWLRTRSPQTLLVAVSSAAVYGAGHAGAIAEDTPHTPFSPYGHHKSVMEMLCRSYASTYGLRIAVARVFSAYGRDLRKQLLWDLCCRLHAGETQLVLDGTGAEVRDWIHVDDVAVALECIAADQPSAAVPAINVATGVGHSVAQVAHHVVTLWGIPGEVRFSGRARKGDPACLLADVSRLTALDFRPSVPLEQGLAEYVQWFRRFGAPR